MSTFKRIVVTDVDGTLFNDMKKVSSEDMDTLLRLHENGICTAVATGRSIWSFTKVAGEDFPVDYLIFSCGAGVMDWRHKQVIFESGIGPDGIDKIKSYLFSLDADFCIHDRIPRNHYFYAYSTGKVNPDFDRRCEAYASCRKKYDDIERATQFLAIFGAEDHGAIISSADEYLKEFKVIRSTSPMDNRSLWMEIFQNGISKGAGIDIIARQFGISRNDIMAVGNDYNDMDMLDWAGTSFVTDNSPDELKHMYIPVRSNNCGGFSQGVDIWLKKY